MTREDEIAGFLKPLWSRKDASYQRPVRLEPADERW